MLRPAEKDNPPSLPCTQHDRPGIVGIMVKQSLVLKTEKFTT